jgi:tRNA threonylcarbamoyladenosine biosynthesis protein TsaE
MAPPNGARMARRMSESDLHLLLQDTTATEHLGAALARAVMPVQSGVLYLHGELGAGKTTCVRGLLRTLGVEAAIRSPTYTLVEAYELAAFACVHVDLYRLRGPVEVDELGLRDYLDGDCLLLVEWPERGGAVLPSADLELTLSYHDDARSGVLHGRTARAADGSTPLSVTLA